jgi:hypothetical protein
MLFEFEKQTLKKNTKIKFHFAKGSPFNYTANIYEYYIKEK